MKQRDFAILKIGTYVRAIIGTYVRAIKEISKKLQVQNGQHLFTKISSDYNLRRRWNIEHAVEAYKI